MAPTSPSRSGRPTLSPIVLPAVLATPTAAATPTPTLGLPGTPVATGVPTSTPCPTAVALAQLPSLPPGPPAHQPGHLPLHDRSPSGQQSHAFWSNPRDVDVFIFRQASNVADIELRAGDTRLGFALRGTPLRRSAWPATGVANAELGGQLVQWSVSDDRIKEDLVLAVPAVGDQVVFDLTQRGLQFAADARGGGATAELRPPWSVAPIRMPRSTPGCSQTPGCAGSVLPSRRAPAKVRLPSPGGLPDYPSANSASY